jgi:hypothetical protein
VGRRNAFPDSAKERIHHAQVISTNPGIIFSLPQSPPILAQVMTFKPEIQTTEDAVRYASTGIGYDSSINIPRFPLRLIFSAKTEDYLPEINVEVTQGPTDKPTTIHSPGPWLDIELPAGKFQVKALTIKGQESITHVTAVKRRVTQVKLVWNISDEDI